ncbi:hypothetical protein BD408DRAFT_42424 [Parasitella parasitica]|nr:hypothetical protein BD408DRAFT_42424 [Parasitella parasitica]
MTDVQTNTASNNEKPIKPQAKKRRLVQAAALKRNSPLVVYKLDGQESAENSSSHRHRKNHAEISESDFTRIKREPEIHLDFEKENMAKPTEQQYLPSKQNLYSTSTTQQDMSVEHQPHSPIHTPPPEKQTKGKEPCYSPLYTVKINQGSSTYHVVDLQVSLFLGLTLEEFWSSYSYLSGKRQAISSDGKAKLWSTLSGMIHQDKSLFIQRPLFFIPFDDIVGIIKRDFSPLSDKVLTFTLDIGYSDEQQQDRPKKKLCSLPPKIAMKMKKCGYKF